MKENQLRRIEVFYNDYSDDGEELTTGLYLGLSFYCSEELVVPISEQDIGKFYFTFAGWHKFGKQSLLHLKATNKKFKIKTIDKNSLNIKYEDDFQVSGFLNNLGEQIEETY